MPVEPVEFEDDLGDALRRTAGSFRPDDPAALVGSGHLRGRRLRRRRTATVVVGAAAIAAVAVGGIQAGGSAKSDHHSSGVAAAPERPKPTASAKPTTAPPVSGEKVAAIFTSLLPDGQVTDVHGTGTKAAYASASAVFNDGGGAGELQIDLQRHGGTLDGCPPLAQNPGTWCSITHVNGGTLMLFKGYEYPDHRGNLKDWLATFVTRDGAMITFSQWNAAKDKGATVTRANPPLDVAEMTAVVTDGGWAPVLAALPDDPKLVKDGTPPAGEARDSGKGSDKGAPPPVR